VENITFIYFVQNNGHSQQQTLVNSRLDSADKVILYPTGYKYRQELYGAHWLSMFHISYAVISVIWIRADDADFVGKYTFDFYA